MSKAIKISLIIILLLAISAGITVISYYRGINRPSSNTGEVKYFTIKSGEGVKEISRSLFDDRLIESQIYFETYLWQMGWESKIKAGEHQLNTGWNIRQIAYYLTSGEKIDQTRKIKIIEGWNNKEIADYFGEQKIFSAQNFLQSISDIKNFPGSLKDKYHTLLSDLPATAGWEGYLFPDTYFIYKNASIESVLDKILGNLDKKLSPDLRAEISRQNKTIYQIITMASVVQKEVRKNEDMKIVSGIFWNRIKIGQPLQSCATLAYVLGVNKSRYSYEDTRTPSPYNTYINRGLPPGPIANPGLNAIIAAIYPIDTSYNYFLTRPDTGETIFSKTLDEHNMNKVKYLQ